MDGDLLRNHDTNSHMAKNYRAGSCVGFYCLGKLCFMYRCFAGVNGNGSVELLLLLQLLPQMVIGDDEFTGVVVVVVVLINILNRRYKNKITLFKNYVFFNQKTLKQWRMQGIHEGHRSSTQGYQPYILPIHPPKKNVKSRKMSSVVGSRSGLSQDPPLLTTA